MDDKEEQANELEALQSIYFDCFHESEQSNAFSIKITEPCRFVFDCTIPDKYPSTETPIIQLSLFEDEDDEDEEENIKDEHLEEEDLERVIDHINTVATENLGMAMVFTLIEEAKIFIEELMEQKKQDRIIQAEQKQRELEAEEEARMEGNRVTPESFSAWHLNFLREMEEIKMAASGGAAKKTGTLKKLTGRELFEKDKNLVDESAFMDSNDVTIDYDLFQGIEGIDLDDEEDQALEFSDED